MAGWLLVAGASEADARVCRCHLTKPDSLYLTSWTSALLGAFLPKAGPDELIAFALSRGVVRLPALSI